MWIYLFADDASLFSVVHDINSFASDIIKESIVNEWLGFSVENEFQPRSQ